MFPRHPDHDGDHRDFSLTEKEVQTVFAEADSVDEEDFAIMSENWLESNIE